MEQRIDDVGRNFHLDGREEQLCSELKEELFRANRDDVVTD